MPSAVLLSTLRARKVLENVKFCEIPWPPNVGAAAHCMEAKSEAGKRQRQPRGRTLRETPSTSAPGGRKLDLAKATFGRRTFTRRGARTFVGPTFAPGESSLLRSERSPRNFPGSNPARRPGQRSKRRRTFAPRGPTFAKILPYSSPRRPQR